LADAAGGGAVGAAGVAAGLAVAVGVLAGPLAGVFPFDLLLDLVVFDGSAGASVVLWDASVLAAFALIVLLVEVVASLASVEGVDPVCCAAHKARLPQISSNTANSERNTPLLRLIDFLRRLALTERPSTFILEVLEWFWWLKASGASSLSWNTRIMVENDEQVKAN
jgi:hypothetical protein